MPDSKRIPERIEVLSPAGGEEALIAAVRSGADAVYLGATLFSARAGAANFDDEALLRAAAYCHERGVKVYLTVNTLLRDEELDGALRVIELACRMPADAVLVQDLGLYALMKRCAPQLTVHASTQMSLHTPAGAALAQELGMSRVVLSREMSLAEMRAVADACDVELEAFVHGALCMSVSGQCYFSAILGSRSGNRGQCAQPCRLPFAAPGGTGHDLSLKDFSFIPRVDELRRAGICSAKIEGRLKRPEYVAAATQACRRAADGEAIPPELLRDLEAVFSRSGFTAGYPDGKLGRGMFGIRTKEDVAAAQNKVFAALHTIYRGERKSVPVAFSFTAKAGQPLALTVRDAQGHEASVQGAVPEAAINRPADEARCRAQLEKTGDTPYYADQIDCTIGEGLAVPASAINALRRDALAALSALRASQPEIPFVLDKPAVPPHVPEKRRLRARFANAGQIPENAHELEWLYLPLENDVETFVSLKQKGLPVAVELPRSMFGAQGAVRRKMQALLNAGIDTFWCGNLGAVALCRELGAVCHGGFSLNVTNTFALEEYARLGAASCELSFELSLRQSAQVGGNVPRGILVYGRQPMMLVRNCPLANAPGGCRNCREPGSITDRKGISFPVMCTKTGAGRSVEILNSVPLALWDHAEEAARADFGVLRFTVENSVECGEILQSFQQYEKPVFPCTRGLSQRGVV